MKNFKGAKNLRSWLESLPESDRERETLVAETNLARIELFLSKSKGG